MPADNPWRRTLHGCGAIQLDIPTENWEAIHAAIQNGTTTHHHTDHDTDTYATLTTYTDPYTGHERHVLITGSGYRDFAHHHMAVAVWRNEIAYQQSRNQ